MTAQAIIDALALAPHPEGGWYRQTWIDTTSEARPSGTAIYYLLDAGQRSHWHRVDATEIWHFYAGTPLRLRISETEHGPAEAHLLGPDIAAGQRPQIIVAKDAWQSAESIGGWALVGCTVSPGFRFDGFTLAAPGFDIPDAGG
ncbi:MAG: cupin domain-containing protein [Pseudomonadota bacterium]